MSAIAYPGLLRDWASYSPRFPFGNDGSYQVVSLVAGEDIPVGSLCQVVGGLLMLARSLTALAGVAVYDPARYDHFLIWQRGDMVPVCRKGAVYCLFNGSRDPQPMEEVRLAVAGVLTTDATGTPVPRCVFSVATDAQYPNTDGSPQADVPYPVPPIPLGATSTTFGAGTALMEVNL